MDSCGQWTNMSFIYLVPIWLQFWSELDSSCHYEISCYRNNSSRVLETRSEENFGVILAYMSSFSTHKFPIQGVQWSLLYLYPNHLANSWPILGQFLRYLKSECIKQFLKSIASACVFCFSGRREFPSQKAFCQDQKQNNPDKFRAVVRLFECNIVYSNKINSTLHFIHRTSSSQLLLMFGSGITSYHVTPDQSTVHFLTDFRLPGLRSEFPEIYETSRIGRKSIHFYESIDQINMKWIP